MNNFVKALFAICLSLFLLEVSFAGGLSAPFGFSSAGVLPKGVRNVTLTGFTTEAFSEYNSTGTIAPLGSALSKTLTWNDLISGQASAFEQESLRALLLNSGVNTNDAVGQTDGVVNVRATVTAPVLAYGLTDKWTTAVAVPILYTQSNVDTGFTAFGNLQQFVGTTLPAQNLRAQAEAAAARLVDVINQQAVSNGYDPLTSEEQTRLGDIKLVQKYNFLKGDRYALSASQTLTLPTGEPVDPNKLVDVGSGDGQWDIGFGLAGDFTINSNWSLMGGLSYTAQLSDNVTRHVPISASETISPDVDDDIYRDLGDIWSTEIAVKFTFFETWSITSGLSAQMKGKDEFVGSRFAEARYSVLELDTDQDMRAGQIGLSYSTLPLFKKKRFPVPLQARLGYTTVLDGTNVTSDPLTSFDLAVFF